ncbi:MAG: hypothetical protein PSY12_04655 [bacterium]|nr:hypothetical protein [bacterium]
MLWAARQLCAPLRYLMISQGTGLFTSKLTYDFVLPAIVSVSAGVLVCTLPLPLGFFASQGLIPDVISLLNLLIAFFIAALAAVATFDRPGLDEPMKGEPAILRRRNKRGVKMEKVLSHRQFVCYLFGFLSFASLMTLLGLYIVRMFKTELVDLIQLHSWIAAVGKPLAAALFFFVLSQLVVTMLLGVYFLCDRLQFLDDKSI